MLLPARRLVQTLIVVLIGACAQAPAQQAPPPAETAAESTSEFNMVGRADAEVLVIEFTDLQCPYCAQFALQTFPRLKAAYIDTGKIRYASRDLPLPMHAHAETAAVAARCAGEQGRYWEYRHTVFAAQRRLGSEPWDELARELKLDIDRFDTCRRDGHQLQAVRSDMRLAMSNGLSSTPSFVIGHLVNGEFVGESFSGVGTYETFAAKIDALLAR
jgi:protein-disulfide isomerase